MKEIKVKVPEGITEFSVNINGETATVVYETETEEIGKKEEWQPKDGEIVFAETNTRNQHFIFPYCHMEDAVLHDIRGKYELDLSSGYLYKFFRPATEKEKKMFHDALKEKGLRWNAEENKVEKIPRWRADLGGNYYYIDTCDNVNDEEELFHKSDDERHLRGNYFKTREAAERVAEQIRKIFKNSKAE